MKRARTLCELYSFPGFSAAAQLKGVFGDPDVRVVRLRRKKRPAPARAVVGRVARSMIGVCRARGIFRLAAFVSSLSLHVSA
ncbi:MAG: hypothetical protein R3B95_17100 [Nitrospirales bacterium]|nr:hypothetical protein [Nitrospirales bacterium]